MNAQGRQAHHQEKSGLSSSEPFGPLEKDRFLEKRFNWTQSLRCVFQRNGGEKEDLNHSGILS